MRQHSRGILKSRQSQPPAYVDKFVPLENNMTAANYRKIEVFVPCLSINKAKIQPLDGDDEEMFRHPERSRSSLSKKYQLEYTTGTISHRLSHLKNRANYIPTYRMTNAGTFVKDLETNKYVHEIRRPATSLSSRQLENNSSVTKEYEIPKSQKPENRFKLPGQGGDGCKKVTFNVNCVGDKVTRIETYYMSEKGEKYIPIKDEPAPLTLRNLEIHQALLKPLSQPTQPVAENLEFITQINRERIASWISERVRDIPELTLRHAENEIGDTRGQGKWGGHFHVEKPVDSDYDRKENMGNNGQVGEGSGEANSERPVKDEVLVTDDAKPEEPVSPRPRYRLLHNMLSMSEFRCERIGIADDLSSVATTEFEKELGGAK
jgi:hypothetical protein